MVVVVNRLQRVVHLCAFIIAGGESGVPFFSLAIPEVLYSRSELHLQITWVIFVDLSTKSHSPSSLPGAFTTSCHRLRQNERPPSPLRIDPLHAPRQCPLPEKLHVTI